MHLLVWLRQPVHWALDSAMEKEVVRAGEAKVMTAKREFPEAPDPAIGMQDERGGRGA